MWCAIFVTLIVNHSKFSCAVYERYCSEIYPWSNIYWIVKSSLRIFIKRVINFLCCIVESALICKNHSPLPVFKRVRRVSWIWILRPGSTSINLLLLTDPNYISWKTIIIQDVNNRIIINFDPQLMTFHPVLLRLINFYQHIQTLFIE